MNLVSGEPRADEIQGAPSRGIEGEEGPSEARSNEGDRRADPRNDPWKGFRGVCSGILILEMVAVLLGVPVVENLSSFHGPGWAPTTFVLCFAALLFVACAVQSRPWAFSLDLGLQPVLVAGWLVHPALGIAGVIFAVVWGVVWWMRRGVQKAQASRYDG
ncbi:MAG: DUF4233 domain-containing protein [Segniliparus sp.]|uniref:DUF4233 domain-containing protein n=1 Tax=Segniliparus sp. TaxID=2804064 RepID=UPI003F375386